MSAEAFNPEHFRAVILDRMDELDLNNETISRAGGPSTTKMTQIRKADPKPPRVDIYRKLDVALRWQKGSARRVAAGGEPSPLPIPMDMAEVIAEVERANISESTRRYILRALGQDEPPGNEGVRGK